MTRASRISVCTIFEKHYHFGLASLCNSLYASGYTGTLYAGYRGELPKWIINHDSFDLNKSSFSVEGKITVSLSKLSGDRHPAYLKPLFMKGILDSNKTISNLVYADPDIVIKCNWVHLASWLENDLCLFEDINWNMPSSHPKRQQWADFFSATDLRPHRKMERYYNSGFVAISARSSDFLRLWLALNQIVENHNAVYDLKSRSAADIFHSTDQDALNYALMCADLNINSIGPEGMDFAPGGYYLSHAIGKKKPWLGKHLLDAAKGISPSTSTKNYYKYANVPLRVYAPADFIFRKISMKMAAGIGRFYRRS